MPEQEGNGSLVKNNTTTNYCLAPSANYYRMLDECGDDPRSVAGRFALNRIHREGWQPTWDARDARK